MAQHARFRDPPKKGRAKVVRRFSLLIQSCGPAGFKHCGVVDVEIERHADEETTVGGDIDAFTVQMGQIGGEQIADTEHGEQSLEKFLTRRKCAGVLPKAVSVCVPRVAL